MFSEASKRVRLDSGPEQRDWICDNCGIHNYAFRDICRGWSCGLPLRRDGSQVRNFGGVQNPTSHPSQPPFVFMVRPDAFAQANYGSWVCCCGVDNYVTRSQCRRCNRAANFYLFPPAANPFLPPGGASTFVMPNEWICGRCDIDNYGWRSVCRDCGLSRGDSQLMGGGSSPSEDDDDSRASTSEDDEDCWICGRCNSDNNGQRSVCCNCGRFRGGRQPIEAWRSSYLSSNRMAPRVHSSDPTSFGWSFQGCNEQSSVEFYRCRDAKMDYYPTTGTVKVSLDKIQLFRRNLSEREFQAVLQDPRVCTGQEYQRRSHKRRR